MNASSRPLKVSRLDYTKKKLSRTRKLRHLSSSIKQKYEPGVIITLEEARCMWRWLIELLYMKPAPTPMDSQLLELGD